MGWESYHDALVKRWGSYSTIGTVHIHAVLVDFKGLPPNPQTEALVKDAIAGSVHPDTRPVSLKKFYEDVSRGRLHVGSVTTHSLAMPGNVIDKDTKKATYTVFFKDALKKPSAFAPRTYFMFGFNKSGASGSHLRYRLDFDLNMKNESSIAHEFGHCLGLRHARVPVENGLSEKDADRGDKSDRMGAKEGWIEFNAPNLIHLQWLDDSFVEELRTGEHFISPLEYCHNGSGLKKVFTVPVPNGNCLYLSMRDVIGPYDSKYLSSLYAQKLCVHTWVQDPGNMTERKTCLLDVLGKGEQFPRNNGWFSTSYGDMRVKVLDSCADQLKFRIDRR